MPYSGTGAGTESDPYIITTVAQWNEIYLYESSFFKLANDIDAAGQAMISADAKVDLNGRTVSNIETVQNEFGTDEEIFIKDPCQVKNGELNFNWSADNDGLVAPIAGSSNGLIKNISITGSITNTNASGSVCGFARAFVDSQLEVVKNIRVSAHLSAHNNIIGLVRNIQNVGYCENAIFIGQMTDLSAGGTATKYGLSNTDFNSTRLRSCFWDTEVSGASSSNGGTGKTTAELQDIATYTDAGATTGLDASYLYDIATEANYSGETWILRPSSYPELYNALIAGTITYDSGPSAGQPVDGARVFYFQADNLDLDNLQLVQQITTGADGKHAMTANIPVGKVGAWASHYRESDGTTYGGRVRIPNSFL